MGPGATTVPETALESIGWSTPLTIFELESVLTYAVQTRFGFVAAYVPMFCTSKLPVSGPPATKGPVLVTEVTLKFTFGGVMATGRDGAVPATLFAASRSSSAEIWMMRYLVAPAGTGTGGQFPVMEIGPLVLGLGPRAGSPAALLARSNVPAAFSVALSERYAHHFTGVVPAALPPFVILKLNPSEPISG